LLGTKHCKNFSTSGIPLVCSIVQNNEPGDDNILSVLDWMGGNLSEVESIVKLMAVKNLVTELAHQAVNSVMGKWLRLSVGAVMCNGK
jgi:hypothetical protein